MARVNTMLQLGFAVGMRVLGSVLTATIRGTLESAGFPDPALAALAIGNGRAGELIATFPADDRSHAESVVHAAFAAGLERIFLVDGVVALAAEMRRTPPRTSHARHLNPADLDVKPAAMVRLAAGTGL